MARLLPPVLDDTQLPLAELWAALRDGELVAMDERFVSVDTPIDAELRGAVLAASIGDRLTAERATAAWVHGVLARPPAVPQLCVSRTCRVPYRPKRPVVVREVRLDDDDIEVVGGMPVTDRGRTAFDLLLGDEFDLVIAAAVTALLADPLTAARCEDRLRRPTKFPGRARALRRVTALQVQPACWTAAGRRAHLM